MIIKVNNKKRKTGFLSPKARLTFAKLRQAFNTALIFYYFDPKYHIRIETGVSG